MPATPVTAGKAVRRALHFPWWPFHRASGVVPWWAIRPADYHAPDRVDAAGSFLTAAGGDQLRIAVQYADPTNARGFGCITSDDVEAVRRNVAPIQELLRRLVRIVEQAPDRP